MESHFLNQDDTLRDDNTPLESLSSSDSLNIGDLDVDDLLEEAASIEDEKPLSKSDTPLDEDESNVLDTAQTKQSIGNLELNTSTDNQSDMTARLEKPAISEEDNYPNTSLLMNVNVTLSVEIGRTRTQIGNVLNMGRGTIVELDKLYNEPVDIVINNKIIAQGQVVAVDEYLGVKILHILHPEARLKLN